MSPEVFSRLVIALGLIAFGLVGYWLINQIILKRARRNRLGLEMFELGRPAILYFTTPSCIPCKTVQRPAIARLVAMVGDGVQLIEVDAMERPDLANYWGVLSVPTTFMIDSKGEPRRINHGVTGTEKLIHQLEKIEGGPLVLHTQPDEAHESVARVGTD